MSYTVIIMEIDLIPTLFGLPEASGLKELSSGHINRTFLAECGSGKYILQSLNSSVFRSPQAVMNNIRIVGEIIGTAAGTGISVPHFIAAGDKIYAAADNEIWRMYRYIPAAADAAAEPAAAGLHFGEFIRLMDGAELDPQPAIKGFHDLDRYCRELSAAGNPYRRIDALTERLRSTLAEVFTEKLRKRVIHGDAKPDNIIISETPVIIDLDTVMYGYAAIDYGDLVRSVYRSGAADLSAVRALTRGFAQGLDGVLEADEINSLYYGILWCTGELAIRYLTDSQREEKYFRGKSSADCLARAEQLFGQLEEFTAKGSEIKELIHREFMK